jgi:hypothetical protein
MDDPNPNPERRTLLNHLDAVERVVIACYRAMLLVVLAAVVAVVALVIRFRPWGDGHQGEWFYFSVAVLMVLGWAIGQWIALNHRQRQRSARPHVTLESCSEDGLQTWTFRFGQAPAKADSDL